MYSLYSWRNSYSMTAQAGLEELGLDYELKWTTIHIPLTDKDPGLVAANPNGRVPTLITPDGPLYETGAILVYLAERHPEGGLMPALDDPRRRLYWQWHFYLVSTFQPEELVQDSPDRYFPEGSPEQAALMAKSMDWLRFIWGVLDEALAEGPYFLGDLYTTCDISFALQALWRECQPPEGLARYPNAQRSLATVLARPAVRKVLRMHRVEHLAEV
jgi:glutathione S-transferase